MTIPIVNQTTLDQAVISCDYLIQKLQDNALSELDDRSLIRDIANIKMTIAEASRFYRLQSYCCGVEPDEAGLCPICREHIN